MGMRFVNGTATHQLDAKYRTHIPTKFRSAFPPDESLHFVQYSTGCVAVMCTSVMEKNLLSIENVDPADEDALLAKRFLYSRVEDLVEDGHGRIRIPKSMREYAGLTKNLISVGMGDYIEIWEESAYMESMKEMTVQRANRLAKEYRERSNG